MTELRDVETELDRLRARLLVAALAVLLGFALVAARLAWLQVVRHDELATRAEANRIAVLPLPPDRGLVVDRHGVVLANNEAAYTLEVTPSAAGGARELDPLVDKLAQIVDITPGDRRRFRRALEEGKRLDSIPLRTRLDDAEAARLAVQRWRLPGVDVQARLLRHYPLGATASHLIGYIGRINEAEKRALEDGPEEVLANYRGTQVIGKLGIEQHYEDALHGATGFAQVEQTAGGRAVRELRSQPPRRGDSLELTVDAKLQALVERLFGDRRGALVAIDPRNGELLALVSMPTFDPNLFVDGIDAESWRELNESIDRPLLNRAIRGTYPPGSTYKPFMAIAALTSGKRRADTVIHDGGRFTFGNRVFRNHGEHALGPTDMTRSIVKSSNVYYYSLAAEMGVDLIHDQLAPFGFGQRTGIDLTGELTGVLPSTRWKRETYRTPEQQRWYPGETISLGIGQGYNSFTILQLAHATATLAAGGQRRVPHLVRTIVGADGSRREPALPALDPLALDPKHVRTVLEAMEGVAREGTSARVFAGAAYRSGGKTGTAQAVAIRAGTRYDAAKLAEHQRDHSLYIALAPVDAPQVAVAAVVENAGFGAVAAAPIVRRVLDYLLLGQVPSEEDIALTQRGLAAAPTGTPRRADEVSIEALIGAPGMLAAAAE
ncbi:MAG: penicillin-binding protein 2 [Burkholderiales bacterium]|nr:penicillin-binding protein 2 [Burkholderiales bacterium]